MQNVIFKNAYILTLADNDLVYGEYVVKSDINLVTYKNKIIFIGTKDETNNFLHNSLEYKNVSFVEYDCKGNLLMPSFKNMHTHSGMSFLRGTTSNVSLFDWLHKKIFPYEKYLEPEDVYYFTCLSILEYLQNGITMAFDMYFFMDSIIKAVLDLDFRMCLVDGATSDTDYGLLEERYHRYNHLIDYKKEFVDSELSDADYGFDLVSYNFGMHSIYLNDKNTLKKMSDLTHKYSVAFSTHNSETRDEIIDCKSEFGKTPTAIFNDYGLFDFGGYSYHNVYLDENDIEILKNKNVNVVLCLGSNLKLKSGIVDIRRYKKCGLNISLGTDGPASNDALSIIREMALTSLLQKDVSPYNANSSDILDMACKNGVKNLYDGKLGALAIGNIADIIMIDLHKPNMWPLDNIINNLVYSLNESNVIMTMVNGKILYDKGKYNLPKVKKCIFEMSDAHKKILNLTKKITEGLMQSR